MIPATLYLREIGAVEMKVMGRIIRKKNGTK